MTLKRVSDKVFGSVSGNYLNWSELEIDLDREREQGCGIRKENEFPEGKVGFIQLIK